MWGLRFQSKRELKRAQLELVFGTEFGEGEKGYPPADRTRHLLPVPTKNPVWARFKAWK